jgi:hypothetical protein
MTMSKKTFPISTDNQSDIRKYIVRQFTNLSWWPAEGPLQAREEFEALDPDSPEALENWCQHWLDGGQWRQLRVAMEHVKDTHSSTGIT